MPINSSGSYDSNKFRLAHMIYEILPCNSWEKTACCSCLKGKYKENKRDNRKKKLLRRKKTRNLKKAIARVCKKVGEIFL